MASITPGRRRGPRDLFFGLTSIAHGEGRPGTREAILTFLSISRAAAGAEITKHPRRDATTDLLLSAPWPTKQGRF